MIRQLLLVCAFIFLVFLSFTYFMFQASASLIQKQKDVSSTQTDEKTITAIKNELAQNADKVKLIDTAFPTKKDLPQVVQFIDTLGTSSNVVASLHFDSDDVIQDASNNTVVPITVNIEGQLSDIKLFMNKLSESKYFITFITADGDSPLGLGNKQKVTLTGNLYVSSK